MNLSSFLKSANHAAQHILGGVQAIIGDRLNIDFTPLNYTPAATPEEATSVDDLSAHLYGIDQAIVAGPGMSEDYFGDIKKKQTIRLGFKDYDEFYLYPGCVVIDDGSDVVAYYITSTLTKQVSSITAETVYYVYVDPPASGTSLAAADVEYGTTAPTFSASKQGYYHPTNTDQRCIGGFYVDVSTQILNFDYSGNEVWWRYIMYETGWIVPSNTYTDALIGCIPLFGDRPLGIIQTAIEYTSSNEALYLRVKGETNDGWSPYGAHQYARGGRTFLLLPLDSSGYAQVKWGTTATAKVELNCAGFVLPDWVYNQID
jgi:hypothetical protein